MSGLRSWTGIEFHRRGPAAVKVVAITTECSKQTGGLVSTTGCIVYTLLNRGERNMQETFLVALQVTDFISDV